jgi:DNA polymerase IV (DinB-like DNA polymerase)
MDYFFAQIEERENPHLKGKPIVVGADPAPKQVWYGASPKGGAIFKTIPTGRGVVSTANYIARKYGIHSALPISKAYRLYPEAVFLPVNMELYQKVSEEIMEIIRKYSKIWETVSLDEAYLDLSFLKSYKKAEDLAKKLKREILEKEKLTSSIGIGSNKLIAKLASDKNKPDGLLIITPEKVIKFLEPLDIEDLPGIGPKTAEKLREKKVNIVKELKKLSKSELKNMFGVVGETIYERARGIDEREVISEEVIKSIGKEHTFEKDTRDPELIFKTFDNIIEAVWQELTRNHFSFKTVTVVCRFQGFETHTKAKTLEEATNSIDILRAESKKLLLRFIIENPKLIRLIGVKVSSLITID